MFAEDNEDGNLQNSAKRVIRTLAIYTCISSCSWLSYFVTVILPVWQPGFEDCFLYLNILKTCMNCIIIRNHFNIDVTSWIVRVQVAPFWMFLLVQLNLWSLRKWNYHHSWKYRFAKVGNTATGAGSARTSRHLHSDDAAGQNEMTSRALDGANGSWRLSLLRSVMGDSICETGLYIFICSVLQSQKSNCIYKYYRK